MRTPVSAALIMALTLLPCLGSAQVYSWKDASGKVHYGDRPPAEKQAQTRKLPEAPTSDDVAAAQKSSLERQFGEREKQGKAQEEKKPAETPAQVRQREDNCRQARAQLASLESGQVRFTVDSKGERVALDGPVRDTELARARKSVDDWCKAPAGK